MNILGMGRLESMQRNVLMLVVGLCLAACSDGADPPFGPDAGVSDALVSVDGQCGPNLKAYGPACIPIFDECADDEVPLPGGGCKKVGVEECLGGWGIKGPPDWTCQPIGVKECDPEWGLSWGPDWKCESIGPPRQCEPGPTPSSAPICQPVMPDRVCSAGLMPVVGSLTCVPIQDCGDDLYGTYRDVAGAIYVHAGYEGRASDGSMARPFRTIREALAAAPAHAKILVGDGRYEEALVIEKPVQLLGRCPQRVELVLPSPGPRVALENVDTLVGRNGVPVPVHVRSAGPVLVQGMAISSQTAGVVASGEGAHLELRGCEVADCASMGVVALDGAVMTVRHSRLHRNTQLNLGVQDARVVVEDSALTDGQSVDDPLNGKVAGFGLHLFRAEGEPSAVVRRSLILRNRGAGIVSVGADLAVEDSIIAETREHEDPKVNGEGIFLLCKGRATTLGWSCDEGIPAPRLSVQRSLIARNHVAGAFLVGAHATISRSVVKDVFDQAADDTAWGGIVLQGGLHTDELQASVEESIVARNPNVGVVGLGVHLRMVRSVVRDSELSRSLDPFSGKGVAVVVENGKDASLELSQSLIVNNRASGVEIDGVRGRVVRSVISDTRAAYLDGEGPGLFAGSHQGFPADVTVEDSLFARNVGANLIAWGCQLKAARVVVRDAAPRNDGMHGFGILAVPVVNVDANGNVVYDDQANPYLVDRPAHVVLEDALIANNRANGALFLYSSAEVVRTIVRETATWEREVAGGQLAMSYGNGIWVEGHPKGTKKGLLMRQSLITRNHQYAVYLRDSDATLQNIVVRDTRPDEGSGFWGRAINAITPGRPSRLRLEDSLIEDNSNVGLALLGASAEVRRSVLRGTQTTAGLHDETGEVGKEIAGDAIYAVSNYALLTDEGTALYNVPGTLLLEDSLVEQNERVGLFVDDMESTVRRSLFRANHFPIYYEEALPQLDSSNVFEQNVQDAAVTGLQLEAAPAPLLPRPSVGP